MPVGESQPEPYTLRKLVCGRGVGHLYFSPTSIENIEDGLLLFPSSQYITWLEDPEVGRPQGSSPSKVQALGLFWAKQTPLYTFLNSETPFPISFPFASLKFLLGYQEVALSYRGLSYLVSWEGKKMDRYLITKKATHHFRSVLQFTELWLVPSHLFRFDPQNDLWKRESLLSLF